MSVSATVGDRNPLVKWILYWLLAALGVLVLLVWFGYSRALEITVLRNVVHYQVVQRLGGVEILLDEPPGDMVGQVVGPAGGPVAGATALDLAKPGCATTPWP
jgi:hypothetical protein